MRGDELLAALIEERTRHPDLSRSLDLHIALVSARAEVKIELASGWLDLAVARLDRNEPAISIDDVELDWGAVGALARAICEITARHEPLHREPLAAVEAPLEIVPPDAVRALVIRSLGDPGSREIAEPNSGLLSFVMNQALHPFLKAYAAMAAPLLERHQWLRGDCPVCGGHPDFASLESERRLLCSRCDCEWVYRRIGCPFCGNEDPVSLGYFLIGDGAYRLYVCERCEGYLKTVDLRETWLRRPLPVERILTGGMDLAAQQQGYG